MPELAGPDRLPDAGLAGVALPHGAGDAVSTARTEASAAERGGGLEQLKQR